MKTLNPQVEVSEAGILLRLEGYDDIDVSHLDLAMLLVNGFTALSQDAGVVEALNATVRTLAEDVHDRLGNFLGVNDGIREEYASDAQGIMYAQHNPLTRQIEFIAVEVDEETHEPSGGVTFSVPGDVAVAWATQIMACVTDSGLGSIDALISARNHLTARVESQFTGRRPNDNAASVTSTIFSWLSGADKRAAEIEADARHACTWQHLTAEEASGLDRFCSDRPDLRITPGQMLRGSRELDHIARAAGATAQKVARNVGMATATTRMTSALAATRGDPEPKAASRYDLEAAVTQMFDQLLSMVGGRLLDQLGAMTGTAKMKLSTGWGPEVRQMADLVCNALNAGDEVDDRTLAQVGFIARHWAQGAMMATAATYGFEMISTQGMHAGQVHRPNGSEPGPLFPIKTRG